MTDSKKIDDGGQAFPHANPGYDGNWDRRSQIEGMSLRDWFAGQALAGMFNHAGWVNTIDNDQAEAAKRAYLIADAMIAARKAGAQ